MEKQPGPSKTEGKKTTPEPQSEFEQQRHSTPTFHPSRLSPKLPVALQRAHIIKLQRTIGNAATQRHLAHVQRQPTDEAIAVWQPPFKLPSASTFSEAVDRLDDMSTKLAFSKSDVISPHDERFSKASDNLDDLHIPRFTQKSGPLEQADVGDLNVVGILTEMIYNQGVKATRKAIQDGIKKVKQFGALDVLADQIAERLHFAFVKKKEESIIDTLKTGLDAVNKYKGYADKVTSWGKTIADVANKTATADFLKKISEYSTTIGQAISHASSIAGAAKSIKGLYIDKGSGTSFAALGQFEAAIEGIDVAAGLFKSVPLFGTIWSDYYKPLTKACLKHLDVIFQRADKMKRDIALLEWLEDPHHDRSHTGAPIIPNYLMDAFPGGQAIMNFMWPVVNGQGVPPITQGIHDFFLPYIEQLNAGLPDDEKLTTGDDRSAWNPQSWFTDNKVVGLESYLQNHARTLWAMLYGSMPTSI